MGAKRYLVLGKKIEGIGTLLEAKNLARHIASLDQAARELGVHPLSDFLSLSPAEVAEYMDGGDAIELPPVRDFSARDGLATVRALLAHRSILAGQVLEELLKCERILSQAAERGVSWHLQAEA